ncbi:MAG: hypothetical protein HON53_22750 [Planctomycetaceae bacterium]|nr:hypothetical protein [Planctomycetaceae bacterium]MBT6154926.1 hypothetical protein [Planctomycetaceae bacterium]MBT6484505.1 hypothetical protein [Planctomycetaceae bacterium]MBT6492958.1 hypothetical protein [Planctomycetaceae bacterium]
MSAIVTSNLASPHQTAEIRNQTVRDPTQAEIYERSAEIRQTWTQTRWRKETKGIRSRRWTVPEVRVAPSALEFG